MQPVHEASDWRMATARMGEARLKGAYAWRTMLDNKVPLAFGSDVPVESPNPFPGIAVAITREDAKGEPFGGWMPQQRIRIEEALAAGITTMLGGGTGPATGTFATTCTPGPTNIKLMLQAAEAFPMNIGFLGKGNASLPAALHEQVDAGVIGLKLHEDWGTTPDKYQGLKL